MCGDRATYVERTAVQVQDRLLAWPRSRARVRNALLEEPVPRSPLRPRPGDVSQTTELAHEKLVWYPLDPDKLGVRELAVWYLSAGALAATTYADFECEKLLDGAYDQCTLHAPCWARPVRRSQVPQRPRWDLHEDESSEETYEIEGLPWLRVP